MRTLYREVMLVSLTTILATIMLSQDSDSFGADTSELPSYQEVVSAYAYNVKALLPFSVEWEVSEREFAAAFVHDLHAIRLLRPAVDAGEGPTEQIDVIRSQLEDIERRVSDESQRVRLATKTRRQFIWTDGYRLQYRKPQITRSLAETLDPGDSIPTSGIALSQHFSRVNIISFVPDREPSLRLWSGLAADERTHTGLVASKNLQFLEGRWLPPLGELRSDLGKRIRVSGADVWTNSPAAVVETERAEVLRGEETLKVTCAFPGAPDDRIDRVCVWVAPKKGFLPLRIERSFSGGPLQTQVAPKFPRRIFEIVEIDEIRDYGGFYYPHRITTTHLVPDPDWQIQQTEAITQSSPVPMTPVKEVVESVLRFMPDRELDETSVALAFPVGTRFLDDDSNEWYLEGTPKSVFDRQLVKELTAADEVSKRLRAEGRASELLPAKNSRFFQPLFLVNVIVCLVLATVFVYSKYRK